MLTADKILMLMNVLIVTLKSIPNLDPKIVQWVGVIESALAGALSAHADAQAKVDPALLTPETPVA